MPRKKPDDFTDPIQNWASDILKKYTPRIEEEAQALNEVHQSEEALWAMLPYIIQEPDAPQTFAKLLPAVKKATTRQKLSHDDIANMTSGQAFLSALLNADEEFLKSMKKENLDGFVTFIKRSSPDTPREEIAAKAAAMQKASQENQSYIQERIDDNRNVTSLLSRILIFIDRGSPGQPR